MYANRVVWILLATSAASAQTYEFGLTGGGAFLKGIPIAGAPAGTSAGFQPGPVAGVWLGQNLYPRWSGEVHYLFELRNLRVTSGSTAASLAGQAHVFGYDLLFHTRSREERVRPYLALGGGMKLYRGTGAETAYRPLMQYAYLTQTQQFEPMLNVGGGVKWQVGRRMMLRVDFRDQITPFPRKLISPAPGMNISGWLHDFVPTFGISWQL